MFETLADVYDGHVAAVLLSGMGRDGTEGAERIAGAGGGIYAQDEASCAVWGMPRSVTERGLACTVSPPEELADKVGRCGLRGRVMGVTQGSLRIIAELLNSRTGQELSESRLWRVPLSTGADLPRARHR